MQSNFFNILALGDVVGSAAVSAVSANIRKLKASFDAGLVIINAENCSDMNGTDKSGASALLDAGADVLTGGNHSMKLREIYDMFEDEERLLRPINLPPLCPGRGWYICEVSGGRRVLVISALGQLFMSPCDSPFLACDRLLKELEGKYDIAVCDLHAEATSEKAAFAEYFDGRIQVIYGTHTHVQTSDRRFFSKGSCLVTDIGMCGVCDSVLGTNSDSAVRQFVTSMRGRYELAKGSVTIHGALFTVNTDTKCVTDIQRIELQ